MAQPLPKHKKLIAAIVPLAVLNIVISLAVGTVGGAQYEAYTTWLAAARVSPLLAFGFYSGFKYEITLANLAAQFALLLVDVYFSLVAVRTAHYVTLAFTTISTAIQAVHVTNVRKLLKCEVDETKRLPRSKVQMFSVVNGIVIAIIAYFVTDMPWIFILAAEINIYELYVVSKMEEDSLWFLVAVIGSGVANLLAHFATYSVEAKEIVEIFDVEQHTLRNIGVYSLRVLTVVNLAFDAFNVLTITPLIGKLLSKKASDKKAK